MSNAEKRHRPKFTARGKQFLQWSILILAVGFYFTDRALISVGILLILMTIVCRVMCARNFKGIRIRRETPEAVFANDEFSVFLYVKHASPKPVFCISLKDFFLPEKKSNFLVPEVTDKWTPIGRVRMKVSKRGVRDNAKIKLSSDFPLGLFKMEMNSVAPVNLTVYPEPLKPLDSNEIMRGHEKEAEREFSSGRCTYGSFKGLREFSPGDPVKLISWRLSARSETLMVRDLEPPEPERFVLIFHSVKVKNVMPNSRKFEKSLRLLSGLFMELQSHNCGFEFYTSQNNWEPVICDNPSEIPSEALSLLAAAVFGEPDSLSDVNDIIKDIPQHYHCIVMGAVDVNKWVDRLEAGASSMTCMDTVKSVQGGGVLI